MSVTETYSPDQVIEEIRGGTSFDRADLRNLDFDRASLDAGKFRRADLEAANLAGCSLRRADLTGANLRDAFLEGANLEGASLLKADLEGAVLKGANLQDADLSHANLEGADLETAKLSGARLASAQLGQANLGGAELHGANLSSADLREACLSRAGLAQSDLRHACLEKCLLEEADLTRADLRDASLRDALPDGASLTGARLAGLEATPDVFAAVEAEWLDFSTRIAEVKVSGDELVAYLTRLQSGDAAVGAVATPIPADRARRFFGEGDVLRNAALEFGGQSVVEVESRFVNCSIRLKEGARLTVGPKGILEGCRIKGPGEIVVYGTFVREGKEPGIVGPRRLIVKDSGYLVGCVRQHPERTQFGLERGCRLRLKIVAASS